MKLELLVKSLIGFVLVLVIQLFSKSKYYVISALVPLFPSLAIFSYYFVGSQGDIDKLSKTIIFGMLSLITYFSFLLALLILSKKMAIVPALICSSLVWFGVAAIQIFLWQKFMN